MKLFRTTIVIAMAILGACAPLPAPEPHKLNEAARLVDQGTIRLRQGDLERARAAFEMAWELAGTAAALDGLGCVAFLEGDSGRAEELFVRAYQIDENYSNSLSNLALLYETNGLSDDARALYERALAEEPENVRARNNFAGYLADRGPKGRAEAGAARRELHRAAALVNHPLINDNIEALESTSGSNEE